MSDQGEHDRIVELERLLEEATDTLDAIRNGEVDAIVVGGSSGQFVYTLENADRPYRVLVEQMKEGAVTLNEDGLLLYVNHSFAGLVGRSAGSLIGSSLFDHVAHPGSIKAMLSRDGPQTTEAGLIAADGSRYQVNMSIVELRVVPGAPRMFCSIITDLTAIRQTQDTLRQAQKMDAVGQLTGGIAHDFNNLLMAISSSLAMLEKRIPDDPESLRLIDSARQGAQRGAVLTQRMLAFARRQDLQPERVDVPALVHGMTELLQRTLGPAWPLHLEFPDQMPAVLADANQLEMALLNLAVNARDAMSDGGEIRISAQQKTIVPGSSTDVAAGDYICLRVVDHGDGMDAATLVRATEPFFTTKGIGKGTGLGLSMIHGLAQQLDGWFHLQSAPGKGTVASLWLPAAGPATPTAAHAEIGPDLVPTPSLKILAVDDDILIRMNIAAMLEDMGHTVVEASSGEWALEIIEQQPDIQLLITDQAMPQMTGTELIELASKQRPGLPIILATGYGELPTGSRASIVKLDKPFTEQELARAVENAIAAMSRRDE